LFQWHKSLQMSHKLLLELTYLFLHISASSPVKRKRKQSRAHPLARKLRALAIEEVPLPDGKLISMTIEETVRTRAMATFNRRGDLRGRDGHDINNVRSIKTPTYVHPRARFASFSLARRERSYPGEIFMVPRRSNIASSCQFIINPTRLALCRRESFIFLTGG